MIEAICFWAFGIFCLLVAHHLPSTKGYTKGGQSLFLAMGIMSFLVPVAKLIWKGHL